MRILPTAVLFLAAASTSLAQTPPSATAKPSRLGMCAACHGEYGMAVLPGAPNLAGQRLDYLRQALADYRDGRRDVPAMRAALGPLSAAELDALARWYSAQSPQATNAARP